MPYIELGSEVEDLVTGYKGIAVSRKEDLNGCVQYAVSGKVDKDGKMSESYYIDHAQLKVIDKGLSKKIEQKDTGSSTIKIKREIV